jgi:DNA-binding MarR family transcriptional regulator
MKDRHNALLRQLARTARAMYAAFEEEVGYALPRWRILHVLHTHSCSTQKNLAAQLEMDPGALTRQLKVLESEGMVTRRRAAEDNRLSDVELTPAGVSLITRLQPRRRAFLRRTLQDFPDAELDATMAVLESMEARFRAAGGARAGSVKGNGGSGGTTAKGAA